MFVVLFSLAAVYCVARSKSSVLTDKSERKIRRQSGEFLRLPHLNPSQKRLRRRCAVDSASALATAYPRHTRALFSLPPLSRCSPVSPQVLWLTCFCFFCCCFYFCCFFLFSQRLRHALPGFSCWRRCCCLLDLPYRLHTVLSHTLSAFLVLSLSASLFFFALFWLAARVFGATWRMRNANALRIRNPFLHKAKYLSADIFMYMGNSWQEFWSQYAMLLLLQLPFQESCQIYGICIYRIQIEATWRWL